MTDFGINRLRRRSFVESSEEEDIIAVSSTFSSVTAITTDDHVSGAHVNHGVAHTLFRGAPHEPIGTNKHNRHNAFNNRLPIPIAKRLSQCAWTKTSDFRHRLYRSYRMGYRIILWDPFHSMILTMIAYLLKLLTCMKQYVIGAFYVILRRRRSSSEQKDNEHWTIRLSSYAYENSWLTMAAFFLLCLQAICLLFQIENFHLHVEDCQYQVEMISGLPASSIRLRDQWNFAGPQSLTDAAKTMLNRKTSSESPLTNAISASRISSSQTTSIRYLQQRFDLLPYDHTDFYELSTCIVLKPQTEFFGAANDIAYFLPRSRLTMSKSEMNNRHVFWHGNVLKSKRSGLNISNEPFQSRFEWTFQSRPSHFYRDENTQRVYATYIPLHSFHRDLFPTYYPDIIFVKSIAALEKMQKFRHLEREKYAQLAHESDNEEYSDNRMAELNYAQSRSQFGIYFVSLAGSVPDIYDPSIRKDWDAFLHVVVARSKEEQQWTTHILTLWAEHPEWPRLVLRVTDLDEFDLDEFDLESRASLCALYEKLIEDQSVTNVDFDCSWDASHSAALRKLKNEIGLHLFPAPLDASDTEEDMVMQSAAVGAIPIVFNSVLMAEYIPTGCGIRIGQIAPNDSDSKTSDEMRLPSVLVDSKDVLEGIEAAQRLSRSHRVRMGRASRTQYLKIRTEFLTAIAALDTAICDQHIKTMTDSGKEKRSHRQVDLKRLEAFLS